MANCFGKSIESNYSSDYLTDKKAKLLYTKKPLASQSNYLLFNKAQQIRNIETCDSLTMFNKNDLVSGLYSNTEFLTPNVSVISDNSCDNKTTINVALTTPFYFNYTINTCQSKCNDNTLQTFKKTPIITNSLINCVPTCI